MKSILKNKVFYVLATSFAACALFATGAALQQASAAETDKFTFDTGASIRIDTTEAATSGIRFTATFGEDLYADLVQEGALKEKAEVGMIIVPDVYYTDYQEAGASDYFTYFEEVKGKSKADLSVSFGVEKMIAVEDGYQINGAIVKIKDANLNLDYRAIAYYTLDGVTYNYQVHSDVRSIVYVADKALLDTETSYEAEEKAVIAGYIGKSLSKGITMDVTEGEKSLGITDPNAQYGLYDENVVTVENGVVKAVGVGETTIAVCAYDDMVLEQVKVTVTDAKAADFSFVESDKGYAEKIYLDKATKNSNQNIAFTYSVADKDGKDYPVVADGDDFYFVPGTATQFTVKATAMRNGENVGEKTSPLNVHDDVYAWLVNAKGEAPNMFVNPGTTVGYTTEEAYDGYSGSWHLKNDEAANGALLPLLRGVENVAQNSTFYFYIKNPTGVALTCYLITDSGYWANMIPNAIITNQVTIPAQDGWQKVEITLDARFDGAMAGLLNAANVVMRITTSDWTYAGECFEVYMTNIYLETAHGVDGVNYNDNGFTANGSINAEFKLPYATSEDSRYSFSYELKKGEETVAFENNAFTPTAAGDYAYVITSKFRGEVIDTETYNFTISGEPIVLAVASYYGFDANGNITLPEAQINVSTEGKTVEYSVTNPAGVTTALGADRIYATGSVHGEYTYTVAIKNGETTEHVETAAIKVQNANVFFACGNSGDGVTYDALNVNGVTIVSYTTEEAAPGELGSMKLSQGAWSYNSAGQPRLDLAIQVAQHAKPGATKLMFWIKHEDPDNSIMVNSYSTNGSWWISQRVSTELGVWDGNNLANNTTYNEWAPHIAGGGWRQVVIDVTDNPGADFRLLINSDQQTFNCDLPIYISNIYYA